MNAVRKILFLTMALHLSLSLFVSSPSAAEWVWAIKDANKNAPAEQYWFRRVFELKDPKSGTLSISCDDSYILHVNGRRIHADNVWQNLHRFEIGEVLKPGKNVVAINAANGSPSPAGLMCELKVTDGNADKDFSTDKQWKFTNRFQPRWRRDDFDDSKWKNVFEIGEYPSAQPWGKLKDVGATKVAPLAARSKSNRFAFQNGDRVVILGGTAAERRQTHGYLETFITTNYQNMDLKFRNLGWSGDDVWGTSRAVFGKQQDGFNRLEQDLFATNPTVILLMYGMNESFKGKENLPRFMSGLGRLVDVVEGTGAAIVLVSPSKLEDLGAPLPNPDSQNKKLRLYVDAMKQFAEDRDLFFVDFYAPLGSEEVSKTFKPAIRDRMTDNGMHFNEYGHWRTSFKLAEKLAVDREQWRVQIDVSDQSYDATGTIISKMEIGEAIEFTAKDDYHPFCPPPERSPRGGKMVAPHDLVKVNGLSEGKWGLQIDGKPTVLATDKEWEIGLYVNRGAYLKDSEKIRELIHEKNELFFHRYRPQNETYLFLFRKHEQGNNAVEIPQFDPLIAEKEKQILAIKKTKTHGYKIVKVK